MEGLQMILLPILALYVVLFLTGRWMHHRHARPEGYVWMAGMMLAYPAVFTVGIWSTTIWGLLTLGMLAYTTYAAVREIKIRRRTLAMIGFRP